MSSKHDAEMLCSVRWLNAARCTTANQHIHTVRPEDDRPGLRSMSQIFPFDWLQFDHLTRRLALHHVYQAAREGRHRVQIERNLVFIARSRCRRVGGPRAALKGRLSLMERLAAPHTCCSCCKFELCAIPLFWRSQLWASVPLDEFPLPSIEGNSVIEVSIDSEPSRQAPRAFLDNQSSCARLCSVVPLRDAAMLLTKHQILSAPVRDKSREQEKPASIRRAADRLHDDAACTQPIAPPQFVGMFSVLDVVAFLIDQLASGESASEQGKLLGLDPAPRDTPLRFWLISAVSRVISQRGSTGSSRRCSRPRR